MHWGLIFVDSSAQFVVANINERYFHAVGSLGLWEHEE